MTPIKNLYGLKFILAAFACYAHVSLHKIAEKYAVCVFFVLSGFLFGLKYNSIVLVLTVQTSLLMRRFLKKPIYMAIDE